MPIKTGAREVEKYFTPDITDIRVGYECERQDLEGNWQPLKMPSIFIPRCVTDYNTGHGWIVDKKIRVPYLTKEQIEAEGWKWREELEEFTKYDEGHECVVVLLPEHRVHIYYYEPNELDTRFWGECKDINTFRYITKLLGI